MGKKIFINLAIQELQRSMDFYTQIGFVNEPRFTDSAAAAMVWSEQIYVMLLTHPRFQDFTKKPIGDTLSQTSALYSLQVSSVQEMNEIADKAEGAGAKAPNPPMDYGFMQQRSFLDPDGHHWEIFYMDMDKFMAQGQ